jgi:hypothetical protein
MSKSPQMEKTLDECSALLFGTSRTESIKGQKCVICKGSANKFSDYISEKEFRISGMCQMCQDEVFE